MLVTEFVTGERPRGNGRTYAILGALLGRLHARPGESLRPGGGWHHLALDGTPADEVVVASSLLTELRSEAASGDAGGFAVLAEALETAAATTVGLPEAFVHPDFVPVNAISCPNADGHPTIVDWTNAGRGPRVWSLGFVLWAAGTRDLRLVDAFMSRYRRHVTLTDAELAALPTAIGSRPLTMAIWSLAVGAVRLARPYRTTRPPPSRHGRSPPALTGRSSTFRDHAIARGNGPNCAHRPGLNALLRQHPC